MSNVVRPTVQLLLGLLLLLQLHPQPSQGKIVGVWTDIEAHSEIVGEYLANASAIARGAGLRLTVDAQVGWAFEANTVDPSRPVHQQVMDLVDEITLMDYFTACTTSSGASSSGSSGPGPGGCDPTQAIYLAAPWLTYAEFLQRTRNRTVLIDVGVAVNVAGEHGRISSEVQLERFFETANGFLRKQNACGGKTASCGGPSFHNFAIFEDPGYKDIAAAHPCTDATCRPAASRPPRAIWYYGMFGGGQHSTWKPKNASEITTLVDWWAARHVTELYVDQYCIDPTGGCGLAPANVRPSWDAFMRAADAAGIDLYLHAGDDAGGGVPATVMDVAAYCNRSAAGTCGPRLARAPRFFSGGKAKFTSRTAAAAGCATAGNGLCKKAELEGHAGCEVGWCSDWKGFWMDHARKGCGTAGFNARANADPAGAWCCQSR